MVQKAEAFREVKMADERDNNEGKHKDQKGPGEELREQAKVAVYSNTEGDKIVLLGYDRRWSRERCFHYAIEHGFLSYVIAFSDSGARCVTFSYISRNYDNAGYIIPLNGYDWYFEVYNVDEEY